MRFLRSSIVVLALSSAIPVFGQSASSDSQSGSNSGAASGPVDLTGFKTSIEEKNKSLEDQVTNEKAIVKKNQVIIEDAKRIDADNKKLEAARKALDAQNAEFERERRQIEAEQNGMNAAPPSTKQPTSIRPSSPAPAPARVVQAPAPAQQAVTRTPTPAVNVAPAVYSAPATTAAVRNSPLVNDVDEAPAADVTYRTGSAGSGSAARPVVGYQAMVPNDGVIVVTAKADGPLRVSPGVLAGMLLEPIRPVYPQMARTAHVEGSVVLDAVISKRGTVEDVRALSGPMILREAAIEAIQSAKYQPYLVGAEPTEVETTITIAFEQSH